MFTVLWVNPCMFHINHALSQKDLSDFLHLLKQTAKCDPLTHTKMQRPLYAEKLGLLSQSEVMK